MNFYGLCFGVTITAEKMDQWSDIKKEDHEQLEKIDNEKPELCSSNILSSPVKMKEDLQKKNEGEPQGDTE